MLNRLFISLLLLLCSGASLAAPKTNTPKPDEAAAIIEAPAMPAFKLLGSEVPSGELRQLRWSAIQNYAGIDLDTPVLAAHGTKPGKTLCLTAAVHGDELNGIEIVRRLMYSLDPKKLQGTLIGVPIVNLHGFQRSSRYLPDRRDLNRHFPGSPTGSSASRIAHSLFTQIIKHCDALVDIHTGSFHRTNLTQVRADLGNSQVLALTQGFGATPVLDGRGMDGTLRGAATSAGIPAAIIEVGEPNRLQPTQVAEGVRAIQSLMNELGMLGKRFSWKDPQPIFYESNWVRVDRGGILLNTVKLGARVSKGQILGTVTDPITNAYSEVLSPYSGRILGMALNQVVMPGYAAYHVGIERSEEELVSEHDTTTEPKVDEGGDGDHEENDAPPDAINLPK